MIHLHLQISSDVVRLDGNSVNRQLLHRCWMSWSPGFGWSDTYSEAPAVLSWACAFYMSSHLANCLLISLTEIVIWLTWWRRSICLEDVFSLYERGRSVGLVSHSRTFQQDVCMGLLLGNEMWVKFCFQLQKSQSLQCQGQHDYFLWISPFLLCSWWPPSYLYKSQQICAPQCLSNICRYILW